ncbi:MAG: cell division ATP-binding protein FtsE [Desulfuromonadales bacterium]|nr:cell division ATP-binding protein FtsE [Desulfuromonadales bacterium]MDT8423483.1 cell division ATP-binding protein FtsE [Desulfuromonadales bacterium]
MVRLYNVCKSYPGNSAVLDDISFTVAKGEFTYLTGPSGAGKSTLLQLVYAAQRVQRGQILVNGQNVTRMTERRLSLLRRSLGIVFQDFRLLPFRTVFENVGLPLEVQGVGRREIAARVNEQLRFVGLQDKLQRRPPELSGGEQQRVAIARALVVDPVLVLADEPTGNLDAATSRDILKLFTHINEQGVTILMASHDRLLMRRYARREIALADGRVSPPDNNLS